MPMKKHAFLFGLILVGFLFYGISGAAQNTKELKVYNHSCIVRYKDGSKANFSGFLNLFRITYENAAQYRKIQGWFSGLHRDTVNIRCRRAGKYVLRFADKDVIHFEVREKEGKLVSDLPDILKIPLNYLVIIPPGKKLYIYDSQGSIVQTRMPDKLGAIYFKEDSKYFSDKFLVCFFNNQFPRIEVFKEPNPRYKSDFRYHLKKIKPFTRPVRVETRTDLGGTVVHNIDDDIYYHVSKLKFKNNGYNYFWLLIYKAKQKKGSAYKLNFSGNMKQANANVFLDEEGKVVLVLRQQDPATYKYHGSNYFVTKDGNVQKAENVYVDPFYRFNNHFVKNSWWYIPTVMGIPLDEGLHTFVVTCMGKKGDGITASSTVQVVFSPKEKYFYLFKNSDGKLGYSPEIINPNTDFSKIDIKKCSLSIDGSAQFPFSYVDESALKGIFYSDMSESEKEEARKSAEKNATVYVGWGPDESSFGSIVSLFQGSQYQSASGPLNRFEGPYPKLRYKAYKLLGEYSTRKEALAHCKKPWFKHHKYQCLEEQVVSVCLDNYRIIHTNQGDKVDFKALFCETSEESVDKGDEIVVVFSAKGYGTKSFVLNKRDQEASDINLSGTVSSTEGGAIIGAKVLIKGLHVSGVTNKEGVFSLFGKAHGNTPLKQNMNIKLQPISIEVSNDELGTYKPGKNFGVVSDGFTTLKLHVKTVGIRPESVVIKYPALGGLVEKSNLKIPLVLNSNGVGEMEYVPPAYLKNEDLNKHLEIDQDEHNQYGLSGKLWAAEVPLEFSYEDKQGNPGSYVVFVHVCRPPVMLIHGFTGDETTWEHLATQLRHDKFDAIIREYYRGVIETSTIEMQAQKLQFYIQKLREAYLKNGILQKRVDIVAHSMGGLISRYYISNMAKYGKKAGVVIPYNVKLSKEQLAQIRFQKPVILNDVRKLIMVGTPNHGSSFLDERLGAKQALLSDYHQLANEELRYDSPFLAELNTGESEGRHLDQNVQYALIYGRRRRCQVYPLDNMVYPVKTALRELVDDDGVVSVKSAKLNGVVSYGFPEDFFHYSYGYIHSPAMAVFCKGDASITVDQHVFNKIEDLLLEDIPRIPLANSVSKIIRASGNVSMRYYSTQNWIRIRTPIGYGNMKKLAYNFCRIKTGAGTAGLGFFLNGHHWGTLSVEPNTIIYYESASPEFVRVYLQQGKARFRSRKQNGGGFDVVMGDKKGEKWYAFNPKARVKDLNTDFIVEEDSAMDVHSISGNVLLGLPPSGNKKPESKKISSKEGYVLTQKGALRKSPLPDSGWWSHIDTVFLKDNIPDSLKITLPDDHVHITFKNNYLPVSGFTGLQIKTDTLPGDSTMKIYGVKISLKNDSALPFINITNQVGKTDSLGYFKTEITMSEPRSNDYLSLNELPLKAVFHIRLLLQQTDAVVFEKDTTLPLGVTLLYGQTVGQEYKIRKQPLPPEFLGTSYQIANETDSAGNYFILFNTTLYNNNVERYRRLANRTKYNAAKKPFDFRLQWPDADVFPLTYILSDSLRKQFVAGKKVKIGKNGQIDLFTPAEQEERVKQLTKLFIRKMKLKPEVKKYLLSKLDSLSFRYGADVRHPVFPGDRRNRPVIYIPSQQKIFWNKDGRSRSNSSYVEIMQAMGEFIQQLLSPENQRRYDFMQQEYRKDYDLSTRSGKKETNSFDKQAYFSFHEAGAKFFSVLLFNYLRSINNDFVNKSIYYYPDYLAPFSDSAADISGRNGTPAYDRYEVQTRFLLDYYGNYCMSDPTAVYSDFLYNQTEFSNFMDADNPAATINEWLITKKATNEKSYILKTGDPFPLAEKYGFLSKQIKYRLVPVSDFGHAAVEINNRIIADFSEIPAFPVIENAVIRVISGKFRLQVPRLGVGYYFEMEPGTQIEVEGGRDPLLLSGEFHFRESVPFKTPLASFLPQSNNFVVTIDPKHTFISVYNGQVSIQSLKDKRVVLEGESTSMNKKGDIKKPRPIKNYIQPAPMAKIKTPFLFEIKKGK